MERRTKNSLLRAGRRPSTVTTIGFLLIAGALIYGCVRLVGNVLTHELRRFDGSDQRSLANATPTPPSASLTPETALSVAAPYHGLPSSTLPPAASPADSAKPAPSVAPAPTPRPTLQPIVEPASFSRDNADLFLAVCSEDSGSDWISLISVRNGACRVLSVPRNTITVSGTPIGEESDPRLLMGKLPGVFPVRYSRYISLTADGLSSFIAYFGALSVNGQEMDADTVEGYLLHSGGDELLRILRQQEVLRACLFKLRSRSWLEILKSRPVLQPCILTNLTTAQQLEMFSLLRCTDPQKVRFELLPVDSLEMSGNRFYQCDALRANALAKSLFPF